MKRSNASCLTAEAVEECTAEAVEECTAEAVEECTAEAVEECTVHNKTGHHTEEHDSLM